jgi:flagellar hook protein FlgE
MPISAVNSGISALKAFQGALDNSANNVANAATKGFQAQQVEFQEASNGGVVVNLSQESKQLLNADNTESVNESSTTDLTAEIVNSIQFQANFELSAKLVKTGGELLGTLIDIQG